MMVSKQYYVYILTNWTNNVLYTGVTNNLIHRIYRHKHGYGATFTKKYKVTKLIYYETFEDINEAIKREKQIKGGSRIKKIKLIEDKNKSYKDLYQDIIS